MRSAKNSKKLYLKVKGGVARTIAEVGEQFAWLGSALRASTRRHGLQYSIPLLRQQIVAPLQTQSYVLEFSTVDAESAQVSDGQCWHDLFVNPVIVKGFPIPSRHDPNTGVEMPLDMMASLIGSGKIDRFHGKAMIKGFSAILIPMKRSSDVLIWHLVANKEGGHISYTNDAILGAIDVKDEDLTSLRHVVGWCSRALFFAGKDCPTLA